MTALPHDLGQRILDAARIALALHAEALSNNENNQREMPGGAGADVVVSTDGEDVLPLRRGLESQRGPGFQSPIRRL